MPTPPRTKRAKNAVPLALAVDAAPAQEIHPFAKNNELPHGSIEVPTYAELKVLVKKWATGELDDTLVILGGAGTGKSETAHKALESIPHCYLKGQATKYGVYLQLLAHQNEPVVLDDVDTLLASKEVTGLMKMLLETRSPKLVQWTTATTMLGETVPASFSTTSRTLILANELKQVSKNFSAVLDRATVIWFCPSPEEIHKYVGTWFKEREVYAYVGERLHACPTPSCRYYYHGMKWKQAGLGWKKMLEKMMLPAENKAVLVKELEVRFTLPKDRVAAWKKETGESEQSYWATKKAVDLRSGKRSERGRLISEGMRRRHAERTARESGA